MLNLADYDYILPSRLIAQQPAEPADSCKLLVYDKKTKQIVNTTFNQFPKLIDPNTLVVFNTSKVLKARLPLTFEDETKGEVFYVHSYDAYSFDALVRPGKKFRTWDRIPLCDNVYCTVEAITKDGRHLTCSHPILEVLEKYGQMPLPPYISYDEIKAAPYQPIFAKRPGSVASPTASLHFTQRVLDELNAKGVQHMDVVLHVGLGTFKQVDTPDITQYDIHAEQIEITNQTFVQLANAKITGKPVLAVGTTVARTLETLPYARKRISQEQKEFLFSEEVVSYRNALTEHIDHATVQKYVDHIAYHETTTSFTAGSKLFIYPWFTFLILDELITNFHLPKSSLLMLVAGFIGLDETKKIYEHAISHEYMFYSFGDAMWIRS